MAAAENRFLAQTETEAREVEAMQTAATSVLPQTGEKTSESYRTFNIPDRFENPDCFEGYQNKAQHPMYTTSAMVYGAKKPTVHTMPTSFHCKSQKFSEHLGSRLYSNKSLNTSMDKSTV